MARVSKETALKCLRRALDQGARVRGLSHRDSEFQIWKTRTMQDLRRIYGDHSGHPKRFDGSLIIRMHEDKGLNVDRANTLLESWIEEIEDDWPENEHTSHSLNSDTGVRASSRKVFVVHGHDEAAKVTVARFLEHLELQPIILHEQPNQGRTIIEKFEDHATVGFAVVLLTPDDVGESVQRQDQLQPRARQNVILELGFFIGRLGRRRVCVLVKDEVETPSDYEGVVYTKLDDHDGWKGSLIRELKEAGFDVDANRVFEP